jgi:glycosyltransferase A (GT-A) superfamily protein (DUF2064 family)
MTVPVDLVVIAKEPVAGRVKTRLSPPYHPDEAAALAAAALTDTLEAVLAAPAARRTLVLDGAPGGWLPCGRGLRIIPQRGAGLDDRLAHAFDDAYAGHPMVLIGMDTPQVTPALLHAAMTALTCAPAATEERAGRDAVLGPAADGGFWSLGLRTPAAHAHLVRGVPMSRPDTGRRQLDRLTGAGLTVAGLPELRDVDTAADATEVAAIAPHLRFTRTLLDLGVGGHRCPGPGRPSRVMPGQAATGQAMTGRDLLAAPGPENRGVQP